MLIADQVCADGEFFGWKKPAQLLAMHVDSGAHWNFDFSPEILVVSYWLWLDSEIDGYLVLFREKTAKRCLRYFFD